MATKSTVPCTSGKSLLRMPPTISRPRPGRLIVGGILNKDFPLVQGTVLFVATTYVLINLLVDVAYAYADPRIRVG